MDIPLAVAYILPFADFGRADTYANLTKTWRDKRPIPTQAQLADAWVLVLENDADQALKLEAHRLRVTMLQDDEVLAGMTYEQRVDLLTNVLREIMDKF